MVGEDRIPSQAVNIFGAIPKARNSWDKEHKQVMVGGATACVM